MRRLGFLGMVVAVWIGFAADDDVKALPEGQGKDVVAKVCIQCHGAASFRKLRLTEDEWWDKVGDMVDRGAKADEKQQGIVVAYLAANFGKTSNVNMNTAPISELMVVLGFTAGEAQKTVDYRADHGDFKGWQDVAKVPGVDAAKVETKKAKMAF